MQAKKRSYGRLAVLSISRQGTKYGGHASLQCHPHVGPLARARWYESIVPPQMISIHNTRSSSWRIPKASYTFCSDRAKKRTGTALIVVMPTRMGSAAKQWLRGLPAATVSTWKQQHGVEFGLTATTPCIRNIVHDVRVERKNPDVLYPSHSAVSWWDIVSFYGMRG